MANENLPHFILQFMEEYIETVEQLEILLLLGCHPHAAYSVEAVYEVILSSRRSVEKGLEHFISKGLIGKDQEIPATYRFHPKSSDVQSQINDLAAAYRAAPVRVIEAIYNRKR